ncbi:MAG: phosphoribosylformylglycinamidine cyclo-ligase [Gammaproteobacteria bacterium WSBS_2016_MAG_OTU1]
MSYSNQYRDSGVNIGAGDSLAEHIKPKLNAAATAILQHQNATLLSGIGGFAAAVRLPAMTSPTLVACADGVGTKVELLAKHDLPATAGIDVVAMCVNDLLCAGAMPLFFLDYYACDSLSPDFAARVIDGVAEGCRQAGCALIGGETAEMPGVYAKGAFDLAGFSIGLAEEAALLKTPPSAGDAIIAIASGGPHSNGYSLIRHILKTSEPPPEVLASILSPTRIYCQSIAALRRCCDVRGLAHITGGGIVQNVPRMLAPNTAAKVNLPDLPPVFAWLQSAGKVEEDEMRRVFNCGIGMVAAVAASAVDEALASLQQSGETAWQLGEVVTDENEAPRVIFDHE